MSISELEKQLNIRLPQDYKDFMLKHNGGRPQEDWVYKFVDPITNTETSSVIQSFFVIYDEETEGAYDDLRKAYRILHQEIEEVPPLTLPIADDPFGNLIGMSVAEEDYGSIYFYDHELNDPETGYMVRSIIADSFSKFIDNCYLDEE